MENCLEKVAINNNLLIFKPLVIFCKSCIKCTLGWVTRWDMYYCGATEDRMYVKKYWNQDKLTDQWWKLEKWPSIRLYRSGIRGGEFLKSYDPWTRSEFENQLSIEISREKWKLEKMTKYHESVRWTSCGDNQVNLVSGLYPWWTFEKVISMVQNEDGGTW